MTDDIPALIAGAVAMLGTLAVVATAIWISRR
jgi:hypothetical protein